MLLSNHHSVIRQIAIGNTAVHVNGAEASLYSLSLSLSPTLTPAVAAAAAAAAAEMMRKSPEKKGAKKA